MNVSLNTPNIKTIAKTFFNASIVENAMSKATNKALGQGGKYVMQEAKKSIKPGKKATRKTFSQLDTKARQSYHIAEAIAKRDGKPKPKMPTLQKVSDPGKEPLDQTGLLRQFILYAYDPASGGVFIGPVKLNKPGLAAAALEHGGPSINAKGKRITIKARPFMGPALERKRTKLAELWANSLKG